MTFTNKHYVLFLLFIPASFYACTNFFLKALDGTVVNARTMEFGTNLKSNLLVTMRNTKFQSPNPKNNNGLSWQNKYGYVFLDALGDNQIAVDGMNEKGLAIGALWLPQSTQYATLKESEYSQALTITLLGSWVLGNFATVDGVKKALPTVAIWGNRMSALGSVPPLHCAITDAKGNAIVVSFIKGKTVVNDNPNGVLTNEPTFDWQITNLQNYVNLTPYNVKPVIVGGITYNATGQGSGMVGLPGNWTPPSRFVKASLMVASVDKPKNAELAVTVAQHIMNNFDIPLGVIRERKDNQQDYTQWTVFKDLTNKKLYWKSYNDSQLRMIDLKKLQFDGSVNYKAIPIENNKLSAVEMNSRLMKIK